MKKNESISPMPFATGKRAAGKKRRSNIHHLQCPVFSRLCVWNRDELRKPFRCITWTRTAAYHPETSQLMLIIAKHQPRGSKKKKSVRPPEWDWSAKIEVTQRQTQNTVFMDLIWGPIQKSLISQNSHRLGQSVLPSMVWCFAAVGAVFQKKKKKINKRCKPESRKHLPSDSNTF